MNTKNIIQLIEQAFDKQVSDFGRQINAIIRSFEQRDEIQSQDVPVDIFEEYTACQG